MKENLNSKPITVGQVLYREKVRRSHETSEIEEVTVGKIGTKYFYLEGYFSRYPVDKKTLRHTNKEYSSGDFQLYTSKQEIFDKREKAELAKKLSDYFRWGHSGSKSTLEELRQVVKILKIE